MIEGTFTHQALPSLFRFLAARDDSLLWELSSLAGTFRLTFQEGKPVDIMFNPARPVGATIGLKALRTLFVQVGGRFQVFRDPPDPGRRTLNATSEQLLIEMATLEDESVNRQREVRVDVSAELALVSDLPEQNHQTAFRTSNRDVPWPAVLQLFALSEGMYSVALLERDRTLVGQVLLGGNGIVEAAEYGGLSGKDAFSALVTHRRRGIIDVRDQGVAVPSGHVGPLDRLLMAEFLAGRLSSDPSPPTEAGLTPAGATPDDRFPNPPTGKEQQVLGSSAESLKMRLSSLFRRRS